MTACMGIEPIPFPTAALNDVGTVSPAAYVYSYGDEVEKWVYLAFKSLDLLHLRWFQF